MPVCVLDMNSRWLIFIPVYYAFYITLSLHAQKKEISPKETLRVTEIIGLINRNHLLLAIVQKSLQCLIFLFCISFFLPHFCCCRNGTKPPKPRNIIWTKPAAQLPKQKIPIISREMSWLKMWTNLKLSNCKEMNLNKVCYFKGQLCFWGLKDVILKEAGILENRSSIQTVILTSLRAPQPLSIGTTEWVCSLKCCINY